MLGAGFEPVIPMFERPKTVLALDRVAIETDRMKVQAVKGREASKAFKKKVFTFVTMPFTFTIPAFSDK
jgi:hypothetical protein